MTYFVGIFCFTKNFFQKKVSNGSTKVPFGSLYKTLNKVFCTVSNVISTERDSSILQSLLKSCLILNQKCLCMYIESPPICFDVCFYNLVIYNLDYKNLSHLAWSQKSK